MLGKCLRRWDFSPLETQSQDERYTIHILVKSGAWHEAIQTIYVLRLLTYPLPEPFSR